MADSQSEVDIEALVDLMASLLDLPLDPDHRPGVIANLERTRSIAQLVMEFPLPDDIEVAPTFQP
ncbi:MAG TPA: DUF4089 domain-containing protein [Trichocoleus sp.]